MRIAVHILYDALKDLNRALCLAWVDEDTWFIAVMLTFMLAPFACLVLLLSIIG